jgi:hypothetical protein
MQLLQCNDYKQREGRDVCMISITCKPALHCKCISHFGVIERKTIDEI